MGLATPRPRASLPAVARGEGSPIKQQGRQPGGGWPGESDGAAPSITSGCEGALSDSTNQLFREVFERVSQGVVVVAVEPCGTGRARASVLHVNRAVHALLGRDAAASPGCPELPSELQERVAALAVAAAQGEATEREELSFKTSNDARLTLDLRVEPLSNGHIAVLLDDATRYRNARDQLEREAQRRAAALRREVEERERAERALAHAEAQLRHAQKMEAIGRLASGVAHDFNNLLSVVISSSDLALLRMQSGDRARAEIEDIRKAGQRAAALTRQLLAFSRQQVLQPRVLSLNDVVHGMERMLSRVLGEDILLAIDVAPELAAVKADPSQVEQVIMNLVVNARDAMPTGGQLRIQTRNASEAPRGASAPVPGPHVMIAVSDTGVGMDGETVARVFEPFFTTKERGKGTGLGLSTVFGIVKQSGGSIAVHSALGRGATFEVYLPVTDEIDAPFAVRHDEIAESLKGGETLLLVEDDDQVRALCAKVLRQYGYDVIEAGRPSSAIAAAASYTGAIDLLLTDVVMPEMGGRLLAEHLAAERPRMRVLFMSGYTDDTTMRHGVLESAVSFLQKPFTPHALARSVRDTLARAPEVRESSQPIKV